MSNPALRIAPLFVLIAAVGCGGASPRGDAQGGGDPVLPPPGDDGAAALGTGGSMPGSGGSDGGGDAPATGGDAAAGGSTGSGGTPGTGGGPPPDAPLGTGGGIPSDGGGAVGTGGLPATGGGSGTRCGQPGFPCCTGNACDDGGCCVSGLCLAQGGACVGLGDGTCTAGACGSCGGPGLPCCGGVAGDACTAAGTRCTGGTCARCGDLGLGCCAGPTAGATGVCQSPGTMCDSTDLCVPCGAPGTACCAGSACTGAACCYEGVCVGESATCGTTAGTCQAGRCSGCGASTQPCCPGSTCYDGLLCKSGTCAPCGAAGQACCASASAVGQCQAGLACTGTPTEGSCARCGEPGDICCAGRTCNGGCCSGGRCLVGDACREDGGISTDVPEDHCATGGAPCSALARFAGVQTLDGNDDEFCSVPAFELSTASAAKTIEYNTAGKSYGERAVARVAWDEAGLHAFIRVWDTTFTPASSTQSWNGDGVELMFSSSTAVTGLTYNDANTLHVMVSPPVAQYSRDTASTGTQYALPTNEYRVGTDASGYWIELDLPWPGTPPTTGAQIKFDMQLNIADGTTAAMDGYVRDAQAILYLGTASSTTCSTSNIQPFCDDRLWCTTTLQ